jgi:hypothetical protein
MGMFSIWRHIGSRIDGRIGIYNIKSHLSPASPSGKREEEGGGS